MQRLLEMRHHDPFSILGRHWVADNHWRIRALLPGAVSAAIERPSLPMRRLGSTDLFEWIGADTIPQHYLIHWRDAQGDCHYRCDPYSFSAQLSDMDMHLFTVGSHQHIYQNLGSTYIASTMLTVCYLPFGRPMHSVLVSLVITIIGMVESTPCAVVAAAAYGNYLFPAWL